MLKHPEPLVGHATALKSRSEFGSYTHPSPHQGFSGVVQIELQEPGLGGDELSVGFTPEQNHSGIQDLTTPLVHFLPHSLWVEKGG